MSALTAVPAALAQTVVVALGARVLRAWRRVGDVWRRRKDVELLASFDNYMLRDIGLTHGDVNEALSQPLWRDPGDVLVRRQSERLEAHNKRRFVARMVAGEASMDAAVNFSKTFEGGCYCRKIRYVAQGKPRLRAQCHCRECQYFSGGAPNLFMLMPPEGFRYVSGMPKAFTSSDLEKPVTREFCETCGTHIASRRPGLKAVILKVGTLDNPSLFGAPQMAIYAVDRQPFHIIPENLPTFERLPPR